MTQFEPPVDAVLGGTGEVMRLRPARHVRLDNKRMLAVPHRDRLLTIVCERQARPTVFAVVTLGPVETRSHLGRRGLRYTQLLIDQTEVATREAAPAAPSPIGYLCGCGERHMVDIDAVWERVDFVRHMAAEHRRCDVRSVVPRDAL